jgi:hypothetical protein
METEKIFCRLTAGVKLFSSAFSDSYCDVLLDKLPFFRGAE